MHFVNKTKIEVSHRISEISILSRNKFCLKKKNRFFPYREVVPGAMCVLTNSTLVKCLDLTVQNVQSMLPVGKVHYTPHHNRSIPMFGHTTFLNFVDGILPFVRNYINIT